MKIGGGNQSFIRTKRISYSNAIHVCFRRFFFSIYCRTYLCVTVCFRMHIPILTCIQNACMYLKPVFSSLFSVEANVYSAYIFVLIIIIYNSRYLHALLVDRLLVRTHSMQKESVAGGLKNSSINKLCDNWNV